MSRAAALDPKEVLVQPAGHISREWQIRLPANVAYSAIFRHETWTAVEAYMRQRGGGKRPARDDLVRVIGAGFDVTCVVVAVSDGYQLAFYSGRRPSPVAEILADLDALPQAASSADIKKQAATLSKRWQAAGVGREHLNSARRAYAKAEHPDTNAVDGRRLAAANAVIDHALESLGEAA